MVKEGEKKGHKKEHVIHERKLRYYKKTVQLLTVGLEVFFLFLIAAIIFLFVAGEENIDLETQNENLILEQQRLTNQLADLEDKVIVTSLSLPTTNIKDDQLIASFTLPSSHPTNITVSIDDVLSQVQQGYQRRELVDEVNIPMHTKYAQSCFDFALFCADNPQDIVELKEYYSQELHTLKSSSPNYVVLPLGATTKSVMDFRDFVSPIGFEDELQEWYIQRESDQEFIHRVWYVVSQLTTYNEDIQETPRYPLETLLLGGGDCEDSAILFASMLGAINTGWEVSFLYTDSDSPDNPFKYNHVLVEVKTDSEVFFVETTSKDKMNPYEKVDGEKLII